MDRRESLKALVLGGVGSSLFLSSCVADKKSPIAAGDIIEEREGYGRTPAEEERDEDLYSETFFSEEEMATISILSDIIINTIFPIRYIIYSIIFFKKKLMFNIFYFFSYKSFYFRFLFSYYYIIIFFYNS